MPRVKEGSWPQVCVQRAFVEGAKWWEYHKTGCTMWPSDRDTAEDEAVKRYGEPEAAPTAPPAARKDDPSPLLIHAIRAEAERARRAGAVITADLLEAEATSLQGPEAIPTARRRARLRTWMG